MRLAARAQTCVGGVDRIVQCVPRGIRPREAAGVWLLWPIPRELALHCRHGIHARHGLLHRLALGSQRQSISFERAGEEPPIEGNALTEGSEAAPRSLEVIS